MTLALYRVAKITNKIEFLDSDLAYVLLYSSLNSEPEFKT
jgi:hypothetical protein